MIFAHSFVGFLLAPLVDKTSGKLKEGTQKLLIWSSILIGSIIPDLDIIYLLVLAPESSHRGFITHSYPIYIIFLLISLAFIKILKLGELHIRILVAFVIGAISHITADSFVDTIYPFKPFLDTEFIIQPFHLDKSMGFWGYLKSPYMVIEIIISFLGFVLLIKSLSKFKKEFKILLTLLGIILVGVVIGLVPFLSEFN